MKKIWKHRYQIVEETGKGGNAKVYKVWDLHLEKEWAMKILEEKVCFFKGDEEEENIDELTALKRISHPNFPRIVDAFEEEGRNVLIMDYIQGVTLEEIIVKGPMKEGEMVMLLSQICDAILYLHQSTPQMLYLDLKPSNILIEENRTVKLVDLGSVSIKGKRGNISGSFGYASPEQIKVQREGSLLNEQSDIFSFGMVLYACAAGSSTKLPVIELGSRHGVFVRRENPFLSIQLEKILEKCTRGNCSRRYSSMREVKKDLENWEAALKKKRRFLWERPIFQRHNGRQWYQEKSIFCTEGRHSFFIAKKIMVLLICVLSLIPGTVIWAEERNEMIYYEEETSVLQKENTNQSVYKKLTGTIKSEGTLQGEKGGNSEYYKLGVMIRDHKFRKVLVRDGSAYETDSNILLEIPWEEIGSESCRIMVECEDGSQEKKRFYMKCIYTK